MVAAADSGLPLASPAEVEPGAQVVPQAQAVQLDDRIHLVWRVGLKDRSAASAQARLDDLVPVDSYPVDHYPACRHRVDRY